MGIAERKEREKQKRRQDIIDAAEKVFFSKGLDLSTMDDVAKAAELSKGTLYLYFKSKEDLYLAINARGTKILESMFLKAVKTPKTGIEKIKAIGEAYFEYYQKYPDYFNAHIYYESREIDLDDETSMAAECELHGQRALDVVSNALKDGIADGTIRSDVDPYKTSVLLWAHSTGLIQIISMKGKHMEKEHNTDINELIEYSFDFIMHALS